MWPKSHTARGRAGRLAGLRHPGRPGLRKAVCWPQVGLAGNCRAGNRRAGKHLRISFPGWSLEVAKLPEIDSTHWLRVPQQIFSRSK